MIKVKKWLRKEHEKCDNVDGRKKKRRNRPIYISTQNEKGKSKRESREKKGGKRKRGWVSENRLIFFFFLAKGGEGKGKNKKRDFPLSLKLAQRWGEAGERKGKEKKDGQISGAPNVVLLFLGGKGEKVEEGKRGKKEKKKKKSKRVWGLPVPRAPHGSPRFPRHRLKEKWGKEGKGEEKKKGRKVNFFILFPPPIFILSSRRRREGTGG